MTCDLESGHTSFFSNAGEIVIDDNDSFSSLHWNVLEDDNTGDDLYTMSIGSEEWKLSPKQCTPYEVRIPVDISLEVKHKKCFSLSATLSAGLSIKMKGKAEANIGAEFGMGWESCSEWIEPPNSYVLYANVVMNSPYPTVYSTICGSARIAVKDGYGYEVLPYNVGALPLPSWITQDMDGYIANPTAKETGNHILTLSVLGPCGPKNLTLNLTVLHAA